MNQQETFDTLNEQLKDIPKVQIRLMSLSVLPRLMGALDANQQHCPDCKRYNKEGGQFVNDIKPLFNQDLKVQKSFEKWVDNAQKHLKTKHQQRVKGRLTSTYATIGMLTGCLIAFLYMKVTGSTNYIGNISLGWAIGMTVGYFTGKLIESRLSKNNKLY